MAASESHNAKSESEETMGDTEGPRVDPSYKPKKLKFTGTSMESSDFEFDPEKETRILVLYSGGTIGMKSYDGGKLKCHRQGVYMGLSCLLSV